jgi:hypothetical protein
MFGRYLDNPQAQAIMMPSSFVPTPSSNWYMAAGIHLLNAGVPEEKTAETAPDLNKEDSVAEQLFTGVKIFDLEQQGSPPQNSVQITGYSGPLIAELVMSASHGLPKDKVTEWMNEVDAHDSAKDAESTPEWLSSDDDFSGAEDEAPSHGGSLRECQMSPSNLRPMIADYEATVLVKKKDGEAAGVEDELRDADAQAIIDEQLLAQRIMVMCKVSGERPIDVQAMYVHKLQLCSLTAPHDWIQCPFAHEGEVARRRDPATHSANPCSEYERFQTCSRGDKCRFSHGVWERGLHPQRYRTSLCSKGDKCDRRICFFAHAPDQVRKPSNGRGPNNEAIACLTVAAADTKLSRRKLRALQRKRSVDAASKSIEAMQMLPPPSCKGPPTSSRITVEVDTKLTHLATTVEGVGPIDCISPGSSSGTGDLSIASATSSSQASTIQTVAWSEDNFNERGVAADESHLPLAEVRRKSSASRVPADVDSSSKGGRTSGRRRRPTEGAGVEDSIIEEGNVDVDHLADAECSKLICLSVLAWRGASAAVRCVVRGDALVLHESSPPLMKRSRVPKP